MKELEVLKTNPNNEFTKKEILKISNQYEKLVRSLKGISEMQKSPDLVFIIDTKLEHIAVSEANLLKIPIIGIGGIKSSDDVLEYMLAGAFAVEIGTANYRDPNVGNNIISDINNFLDENNIKSINQIIGKVKLGK